MANLFCRRVGDASKLYSFKYTVEGRGEFPIDMLRYDQAYPADQESVAKIIINNGVSSREPYRVELLAEHPIKDWDPCKARWESFGWRIVL